LSASEPIKLRWPLDGEPVLSASFGEYRGERFHMGIDLSTGGIEGKKVFPVAKGTIYKVTNRARGYGNAVYVRHANGWVSVYGHLAEFAEPIKTQLAKKGLLKKPYFGEAEVHIPIEADSFFAFSGESGSGMPHLHFEIRDAKNHPMDPLQIGLHVKKNKKSDHIRLQAIRLIPETSSSQVNGGSFPVEISDWSKPIQARGKIRVEVAVFNAMARGNRLGVKSIECRNEQSVFWSWKPKKLSYDFYRQAGHVFNLYYSGFGPTQYIYRMPHEHHPILPGLEKAEAIDVREPTDLIIEVEGIHSSLTRKLTLDPNAQPINLAADAIFQDDAPCQIWRGRIRQVRDGKTEIRQIAAGARLPSNLLPKDVINAARLPEKVHQWIELEDWQVSSNLGGLMVLEERETKQIKNGLVRVSTTLHIEEPGRLQSQLKLRPQISETLQNTHQVGLYSWSTVKSKWRFVEPLEKRGMIFKPSSHGRFALLRDTEPPTIGSVKWHPYFTGRRAVVPVRDRQSGLAWQRIQVLQGEKTVNVDSDPDRGWIILPTELKGRFRVTVWDRSGNSTSQTLSR